MAFAEANAEAKYTAGAILSAEVRPAPRCVREWSSMHTGSCSSRNAEWSKMPHATRRIDQSMCESKIEAGIAVASVGVERSTKLSRMVPIHEHMRVNSVWASSILARRERISPFTSNF